MTLNFTNTYHPHSDGQTEVIDRLMESMLRCLVQEQPKQWDLLLHVEFTLSSIPNKTKGKLPFSIVYTKVPNLRVDLITIPNPKSKLVNLCAQDYQQLHRQIKEHIEIMNVNCKKNVYKHRRIQEFTKGELVMIHLNKHMLSPSSCHKLQPKNFGFPYC